jgi:IS30 family transposase
VRAAEGLPCVIASQISSPAFGPSGIARELTAEGFFAHPYHSWERGLNENTNGLIRQYIPKRKDIDDLSDEDVVKIIEKVNNRPRKCLGFKTPNQLFLGPKQHVALAS